MLFQSHWHIIMKSQTGALFYINTSIKQFAMPNGFKYLDKHGKNFYPPYSFFIRGVGVWYPLNLFN